MVDPVLVLPPPAADTFLHLTSTGWTAVGSLIGAVSVLALVAYNWKYLRLARDQTNAAITQANVATTTLQNLQKQLADQQEFERHAALTVLQETLTQVVFWRGHASMEQRSEANSVQLLPDNWSVLAIYVSRRVPNLVGKLRVAGHDLREAENLLSRVLQTSLTHRSPNSSFAVILDSLNQRLDQIKEALQTLEQTFPKTPLIPS
jgi:hypothetical protein